MSTSARVAACPRLDDPGSWLKNSSTLTLPKLDGTVMLVRKVGLDFCFAFPRATAVSDGEAARRDQANKLRLFRDKSRNGF